MEQHFFVHGVTGAVAWTTILFLSPIGVIFTLFSLILLIICLIKKKRVAQIIILMLLSIFLAFPILMLTNVLQVAYPANINKISPSITVRWPLREKTIVGWGGDTIQTNTSHAIWASER